MTRSFSYRPVALVLAGIAAAVALTLPGRPPTVAAEDKNPKDAKAADPAAVERTRATVRMLDNLHKGYVVNITETYVKAKEQTPAATVLKKVFAFMEKNGDGTGRLIGLEENSRLDAPSRRGNARIAGEHRGMLLAANAVGQFQCWHDNGRGRRTVA